MVIHRNYHRRVSASGTLGQIITPSIVIIILGTLAGEIYSTARKRARSVGCSDALTFLGEPAVISVGTLFQAALLPGIMLAVLYALYAFAMPYCGPKALAVTSSAAAENRTNRRNVLIFVVGVPAALASTFLRCSSSMWLDHRTSPSTAIQT